MVTLFLSPYLYAHMFRQQTTSVTFSLLTNALLCSIQHIDCKEEIAKAARGKHLKLMLLKVYP